MAREMVVAKLRSAATWVGRLLVMLRILGSAETVVGPVGVMIYFIVVTALAAAVLRL